MKKFLAILAVAGVMAACNNGSDETTGNDSPKVDSPAAPVVIDSPATHVDSPATHVDSPAVKK
jgi:hypothetical protein